MSLLRQGKAQALTIYLGESDQWHGQPTYVALIHLLRERGCAGATVTRAIAGYGAGARLHEQQSWSWSSDASLVIQVVDQPERLRRLLPFIQEMLSGGLITLQEVDVLQYTHARSRGLPTKLPIERIMETSVTTASPETPVSHIVALLLEAPFRALPVTDQNNHLQGLISTGDLIKAGVLPVRRGVMRTALALGEQVTSGVEAPLGSAPLGKLSAQDVMNQQIRTVTPDTSVREAARLMLDTGLKRLPVVDTNGTLRGMLSRTDLLQIIVTSPLMSPHGSSTTQQLGHSRPLPGLAPQQQAVTSLMETEVPTVAKDASLAQVIDYLIVSPLKRVVVLDDEGRVQGIISDVDVLAHLQAEARPGLLRMLAQWARGESTRLPTGALHAPEGKARIAADVMNQDVVTVIETSSVQQAIERMIASGRKVLPVVDASSHLKGIVGRSHLLRVLLEG
ncbi:CBS domain-containing protein [Ktedonosporobacter rubrisoli]|uniref:CBS domain-containing protein n=1 Tax=Ktedonosporobacter rubrisoli TaxID=2509675 RepID=A0A4P6JNC4_KTERU|nr:DUF190 domain-containing protein [Ktedonosporobacter rubrisoli]QBD76808.1 CBS domain-containing protein [Ktedonosporobacter rubrisoli]